MKKKGFIIKTLCMVFTLCMILVSGGATRVYAGAWKKAFKETFKAMKHTAKEMSNDYESKRKKSMGDSFGKENNKEDFDYDLTEDGRGVIIKGYSGTRNTVVIPVTIEDFPVTHIAEKGLKNEIIYGVAIPDTVISIASDSFPDSMCVIMLPESMPSLPYRLFEGGSLEKLTIPDAVEEICSGAVYCCSNLRSVEFSQAGKLKYIGDVGGTELHGGAFYGCGIEGKLVIPEGVQVIGDRAFSLTKVVTVTIPGSVRVIGKGAFEGCDGIEKVVFEGAASDELYILPGAFNDCVYLDNIDFGGRTVTWCKSVSFGKDKSLVESGYDLDSISVKPATADDTVFSGCSGFKLKERKVMRDMGYKGAF